MWFQPIVQCIICIGQLIRHLVTNSGFIFQELDSLAATTVGFITIANAYGAQSISTKFLTTQTQKGIVGADSTAVFGK